MLQWIYVLSCFHKAQLKHYAPEIVKKNWETFLSVIDTTIKDNGHKNIFVDCAEYDTWAHQ